MTREEKAKRVATISYLCEMEEDCEGCPLDDYLTNCDFTGMADEAVNELYAIMVGDKIQENSIKEPKTITENLTGVIKEDHERTKTVSDILEEVKQEICDDYCKYPIQVDSKEDLFADDSPCMTCPLSRL